MDCSEAQRSKGVLQKAGESIKKLDTYIRQSRVYSSASRLSEPLDPNVTRLTESKGRKEFHDCSVDPATDFPSPLFCIVLYSKVPEFRFHTAQYASRTGCISIFHLSPFVRWISFAKRKGQNVPDNCCNWLYDQLGGSISHPF